MPLESIRLAVTVVPKKKFLNFVSNDCQRKIQVQNLLSENGGWENEQLYFSRYCSSNYDEFLFGTGQQTFLGELLLGENFWASEKLLNKTFSHFSVQLLLQ